MNDERKYQLTSEKYRKFKKNYPNRIISYHKTIKLQ